MHRSLAETIDVIADGIRHSDNLADRKLGTDLLARLAPLLSAAVLGRDVLGELPSIERFFGNTWFADSDLYARVYAKWTAFRTEYETFVLSAMTVNERLVALGIAEAFEQAERRGDTRTMEGLLKEARVDADSIRDILARSKRPG